MSRLILKRLILKNKNPILKKRIRFSDVDPAGLAPASPDVKTDMLTRYTTGPDPQIYSTTKKALLQELFLLTSGFSP